jgi:hypothetical protein
MICTSLGDHTDVVEEGSDVPQKSLVLFGNRACRFNAQLSNYTAGMPFLL